MKKAATKGDPPLPIACSSTAASIGRRAPGRTTGHPSADLLRQLDDDPRRAAHVAEPVAVLVVHQLADQLAAMRSQGGGGCLDVVDEEEDVADARGVGWCRSVVALVCGRVVPGELELAAVIRGAQHHD